MLSRSSEYHATSPPKQNPPCGGFDLWLADQDDSRNTLALRAAAAMRRRSNSLRSLVEPEVLIPVRLNKTRHAAGLIYGWRTRIRT